VDDGHWYLAEDYAFCERVRACGYHIFADTTIRLWHIGTYRYGWEDAGIEQQRYRTFTLNFGDPLAPERNGAAEEDSRLKDFAAHFPWPAERPVVPAPPDRNWLFPAAREVLAQSLSAETQLVVELGSWTGRSTRYIADLAPRARVVAIDHWEGSAEHARDPELAAFLPRLYETFLSECWDYRERIIPVRAKSVEGLRRVRDADLRPDLVYIDADHRYENVVADLTATLEFFPEAVVAGDDWDWEGVRSAVEAVARERGLEVRPHGSAWRLVTRAVT
jgi:predicted O-methyltransferase YrrM